MSTELTKYYETVEELGHLPTTQHAQRWSTAVLKVLGLNLDRKTKKKLAKALPEELSDDLTRVFWLAHFRDKNMSQADFQFEVSKRSGNSDHQFARYPIQGVFHGVKDLIDDDVNKAVADSLAPDISEMWQGA